MASYSYPVPLQVEVTISSAKDLKNVNWRHGNLKSYAVVWVDPKAKCSTNVDDEGDTYPAWNETLTVSLTSPIKDAILSIDIIHANSAEDTKSLIGSVRVPLKEIVDDVGFGEKARRTFQLKRPSGRPHGKLEAKITVRESRYRAPEPYYAPPYGVPPASSRDYQSPAPYAPSYGVPPASSRDYQSPAPAPYEYQYAPPPTASYPAAAPPSGYPYNPSPYGQQAPYGQPAYGQEAYGAGQGAGQGKKSKYGMGTGLAVGAAAGLLGGLALVEGVDYVEDKIADNAADRVEDDIGYNDDDDGGYGGDDY